MRSRATLIPKLFSHWWRSLEQSHRLPGQRFGRAFRPDTFFPSMFDAPPARSFPNYLYRQWIDMMKEAEEESGWSMVKADKDKFRVALEVQQFEPDEVTVKLVDNYIIVEGKHEEKEDDHGIISRHFVRKYLVPDECDPERATSTLTPDGILTITAPRKPEEAVEAKRETTIKIERTAAVAK